MSRSMGANAIVIFAVLLILPIVHLAEERDFRHISYQDLELTFDKFSEAQVTSYFQLLFDVGRNQIFVGARDVLYRLSIANLRVLERAVWRAPENRTALCLAKGQSETKCHNFIKVILTNGTQLFTCGTNSFTPQCTWRGIENISEVREWIDGTAKCPYDPESNVTALMTEGGEYFVGGPTDFSGSDSAVYRSMGALNTIRTNQYNSKWLNGPQFVGSFEADQFVYFVFREAAVEYINCGKIIYSRIARVCKTDSGGELILKDNWTTFVKARLNCSISGDYPFYFDDIQGMSYVPGENVVYATFTTPENSIAGSAICAFNLTAINAAFAGPFKHQETTGSAWEQHTSSYKHHYQCVGAAAKKRQHLMDSSKYQLMDNSVQPTTLNPLHVAQLERFTHITIDVVGTRSHSKVHVVFVATATGLVKKLTVMPKTQTTCVVEIWQAVQSTSLPIRSMQFLKDTDSVYIGTNEELLRIPAQHCQRHVTQEACLNAMDPYCGWNEIEDRCTAAPGRDPADRNWLQGRMTCPKLDAPVDGRWSAWSSWAPCMQYNQNEPDSPNTCLCQTRQCDNPTPRSGGTPCKGLSISVTNCTVHGGWTDWSPWSACSQSCGLAVKTRRRTCGNPAPAHGGRICVGQNIAEIWCTGNPPCPASTPPPRDGQWSTWDEWSTCSAPCGGGHRKRLRRCDNPTPEAGGQQCVGCNVEYEACNVAQCDEQKKLGPWTQWLMVANSSQSDDYQEKRFRFTCRAPISSAAYIRIALAKTEERSCKNDGSCSRGVGEDTARWGDWTLWSECSVSCGGGEQRRYRNCEGRGECSGQSINVRTCNTHSCTPSWGCWTDWSPCSTSCGLGKRRRYRTCSHGNCVGADLEEQPCEGPPCSSLLGWEEWTVWSLCDQNQEQHRKRKCRTINPSPHLCQGHDTEKRMCVEMPNDLNPALVTQASSSALIVSMSCVISFLLGISVAFGYCYWQKKKSPPRIPSSPHYMSSKQNPYITVPLHELPTKRTIASSSNTVLNNTGTLSKLYPKSNDYDTATIKRNSHSLNNGHNRVDAPVDKYY